MKKQTEELLYLLKILLVLSLLPWIVFLLIKNVEVSSKIIGNIVKGF